jgi:hypothetical protein
MNPLHKIFFANIPTVNLYNILNFRNFTGASAKENKT